MTIRLTAFRWVPPFAQGYVRDLRVRWALEEAGLPYEVTWSTRRCRPPRATAAGSRSARCRPTGTTQVEMFESGAIVLHIAARSAALAPRDEAGRARVTTWVIAALNSIEPHAQNLIELDAFPADEAWAQERRPQAAAMLDQRLAALSAWLGGKDYLEGRFTAGDLMMTTVLRELRRRRHPGALSGARRLSSPLRSPPGLQPGHGGAATDVPGKRTGVVLR